jgi:hypothetical protein
MSTKRKVHDLRDKAHTVTARAAIKGGPPAGGQVQDLVAEARNLEREANGLLLKLTAALSQPRRADTRSGRPSRPPIIEPAAAQTRALGDSETGAPFRGAARWVKESRNEVCVRHPMAANRPLRVIRPATIAFSPNIVRPWLAARFRTASVDPPTPLGEKMLTAQAPVGHARYPAPGLGPASRAL